MFSVLDFRFPPPSLSETCHSRGPAGMGVYSTGAKWKVKKFRVLCYNNETKYIMILLLLVVES